MQEQATCTNTC